MTVLVASRPRHRFYCRGAGPTDRLVAEPCGCVYLVRDNDGLMARGVNMTESECVFKCSRSLSPLNRLQLLRDNPLHDLTTCAVYCWSPEAEATRIAWQ